MSLSRTDWELTHKWNGWLQGSQLISKLVFTTKSRYCSIMWNILARVIVATSDLQASSYKKIGQTLQDMNFSLRQLSKTEKLIWTRRESIFSLFNWTATFLRTSVMFYSNCIPPTEPKVVQFSSFSGNIRIRISFTGGAIEDQGSLSVLQSSETQPHSFSQSLDHSKWGGYLLYGFFGGLLSFLKIVVMKLTILIFKYTLQRS